MRILVIFTFPTNIISVFKSKKIRLVGHESCRREMRNESYIMLVSKPERSGSQGSRRLRAAAHQLRQGKHQDMRQETKADVSIMTQTGVRRFL
jgi:hypothetical protein